MIEFKPDNMGPITQDWDGFVSGAIDRLTAREAPLTACDLALIELDDYDGFEARTLGFSVSEFLEDATEHLRATALDGLLAASLVPDRFCVIHRRADVLDDAIDWLERRSAEIDPTEVGLKASKKVIRLSCGRLTMEAATAAMMHLLDQFANGGQVPDVGSLPEATKL